jgi:hypothetical protein
MPIDMSSFMLCFIVFMIIIFIITLNAFKNAIPMNDYYEPYEKSNQEDVPEVDPTELFQAMKDIKVDTSNYHQQDKDKYDEEEGLFEDFTKKHYCITLSEQERNKISDILCIFKSQIVVNPRKHIYTVNDIEELIRMINDDKWKFEH